MAMSAASLEHFYTDGDIYETLDTCQELELLLVGIGPVELHPVTDPKAADDRPEPVALRPVLDRLAAEFAEAAELKGIRLRVVPARGAIFSHPALLGGILQNLMRNAIDYTPRGGRVLVGCRRRGREVRIEIRDSGVGISADKLTRVFAAFSRLDATLPDGLGLGLFIVKHAADFLGHRVEVSSAPGRGSSFIVVADAAPCDRMPLPAGVG